MVDGAEMNDGATLRLVWPQWQGAGRSTVAELFPEAAETDARRGYVTGSRVLDAIVPRHDGPTEVVPVTTEEDGEGSTGGVESRGAILASLGAAFEAIARHDAERILTLGGDCAVSVAPFAALAARYGDDLAVVWIDSHPDSDTPDTGYDGFHAMAAAVLLGHGDQEVLSRLPATISADRFAYAGLHDGEDDALANVTRWGVPSFSPDDLRESTAPLVEWLASTGASKVAIHFDVDTVDSNEVTFGLGPVPGGLSTSQAHRVIADLGAEAEVVGLTVAEFIPRQVVALQALLRGLPLTGR